MKCLTLNTFAAGLLTTLYLAGTSQTASAQFFDDTEVISPGNQLQNTRYNDSLSRQTPQPWRDRSRREQPVNRRGLRTNATDNTLPLDDHRVPQGHCPGGQWKQGRDARGRDFGTTSYSGYRSNNNRTNDRSYQSHRSMMTGWSPAISSSFDPATGRPAERLNRGRNIRDGEEFRRGHGSHGSHGDCVNGQCDCPDGQCLYPTGQRNSRRLDPRNGPASYSNIDLTRRNLNRQYLPTRSPYLK